MNLIDEYINSETIGSLKETDFFKDLSLIIYSTSELASAIKERIKEASLDHVVELYNNYKQPKITCAIMTYNEERCIKRCIDSIIDEVDEMIILDSNSTDKTLDIISNNYHNARIYSETWKSDFSYHRNKLMDLSNNDWVIFLDADEYLNEIEKGRIKRIIKILSYLNIDYVAVCPVLSDIGGYYYQQNRRILNKKFCYRFYGRIHEEPFLLDKVVPQFITVNINVYHDGYISEVMLNKNKILRNIELEKLMIEEEPLDKKWCFFLARSYINLNDKSENNKVFSLLNDVIASYNEKEVDFFYKFSLVYLCKLCLENNAYMELSNYTKLLKERVPDCADIGYFELSLIFVYVQNKLKHTLNIVKESSMNNNYESYIDTEKTHIKELINISLFYTGQISESIKSSMQSNTQEFSRFLHSVYKELYSNREILGLESIER